ncbi:hypothetical protein BT93_C1448 [Corymbia citriodora subsp. variegata]|nr:hypothetical protein BT93_C1448 [Corymbia citriodora subsp. variegata]
MPWSEIPDWVNEEEVSYTVQENSPLKAVRIGVVLFIASDFPRIFEGSYSHNCGYSRKRYYTPISSTALPLKGVPKLEEDQVHLCQFLDFYSLFSKMKEEHKCQVAKQNPLFIP